MRIYYPREGRVAKFTNLTDTVARQIVADARVHKSVAQVICKKGTRNEV